MGIRPNFTPETASLTGSEPELQRHIEHTTLGRLPRLDEVAGAAVFAASDSAGAMSGGILNLTCGAIVD